MSHPAIEVTGLSKRYVIEHEARHDNLRDTLHHAARKLWRRARWGTDLEREEFWALRDVSFAIQPGEVVGIIGRNGAGKSTLLKILSRITEPSSGKIAIRGRVASLLEVGTGFHPDLTGRENIFLNGAILGMSRVEIRRKFDEIVAFAEIERFLDTPVKRYSSGMYVRLAFAVAAHLEPEILIVDEVLAVGDAQFQKKCLGKMQDVARGQGRTILFVSHNLPTIQRLCASCIYLRQGSIELMAPTPDVMRRYNDESAPDGGWHYLLRCPGLDILEVDLLVDGVSTRTVHNGATVTFRAKYRCTDLSIAPKGFEFTFIVHGDGQKLANFWSEAGHGPSFPLRPEGVVECTVPDWPFRTMAMSLEVAFNRQRSTLLIVDSAIRFSSEDSDRYGTGVVPHHTEGILLLPHRWNEAPSLPPVASA